jgi:hypothetical protein
MEFSRVSLEGHHSCATLYVAGLLAELAACRVAELVGGLAEGIMVVRLDLRSVALIDPSSFVRIARELNDWRDRRRGRRLTIEFPERSRRPYMPHLSLVGTRDERCRTA